MRWRSSLRTGPISAFGPPAARASAIWATRLFMRSEICFSAVELRSESAASARRPPRPAGQHGGGGRPAAGGRHGAGPRCWRFAHHQAEILHVLLQDVLKGTHIHLQEAKGMALMRGVVAGEFDDVVQTDPAGQHLAKSGRRHGQDVIGGEDPAASGSGSSQSAVPSAVPSADSTRVCHPSA